MRLITKKIMMWYSQNKRDLPWRETKSPYYIWIAEIIHQQTRIAQGLSYYHNFIRQYPTIKDLAQTSQEKLLKLWEGLGYYSRARNLHTTAKHINEDLNSIFPSNFHDIKKLKGIGDYTAAIIASICYNEVVPALDGNAFRVYSRLFFEKERTDTVKGKKLFGALASSIIDKANPGDFNQAIMDLGATVCTPKNPLCQQCPIQEHCESAFNTERILQTPSKKKKISIKERFFNYIYIVYENNIVIRQRDNNDIWGSLYEIPLIETSHNESLQKIKEKVGVFNIDTQFNLREYISTKHKLSHQNINITFYICDLSEFKGTNEYLLIPKDQIDHYAFPKPLKEFLFKMQE